nr:hypothetical protein L204_06318 [Cryptococcus depauperatus CBS 7855]
MYNPDEDQEIPNLLEPDPYKHMHLRNPLDQRYYDQRRGNASSLGTQSVSGQATSTGSCENRVPLSITDEGNVFTYAPGPSNTGGTQMFSEDEQRSRRVEDFLTKWDYPERLLTAAEREVISKRTDLATPADLTIMRELESKARIVRQNNGQGDTRSVEEIMYTEVGWLNTATASKRMNLIAVRVYSSWVHLGKATSRSKASSPQPQEPIPSPDAYLYESKSEKRPHRFEINDPRGDSSRRSGWWSTVTLESLDTPPGPNNLDQPAGHTGYGNDDDPEQEDGNGGVLGSSVVSPD